MKRVWFGPKRFGWGASPVTWQGWLATFVFMIVFVGTLGVFDASLVGWLIALTVLAAFLVLVARTYSDNARPNL